MKTLMRQAQDMQRKIQKAQEELANSSYNGEAGGGMVKFTITGDGNAKKVVIDPSLMEKDEKEILEDLIVAAFNNAKKKADEESSSSMKSVAGNIPLPPGFKI